MIRVIAAVAAAVCLGSCGQYTVVTPGDVAQNYVYSLADGTYPGACALLDSHTRAAMLTSVGQRVSCPRLLARCLPAKFKALADDQSQLLYASTDVRQEGGRAQVSLTGTTIGKATKRVTLKQEQSRWLLTSPGDVITRCMHRLHSHHRARDARG
jgi:hypothetical protein